MDTLHLGYRYLCQQLAVVFLPKEFKSLTFSFRFFLHSGPDTLSCLLLSDLFIDIVDIVHTSGTLCMQSPVIIELFIGRAEPVSLLPFLPKHILDLLTDFTRVRVLSAFFSEIQCESVPLAAGADSLPGNTESFLGGRS